MTKFNPRIFLESHLFQAIVVAVFFGFLLNSKAENSLGYAAGVADHNVLSPLGIQWADPNKFAGDWTIANAPQPHWLFDVFTWIAASNGMLSISYFAYFIVEVFVFGLATILFAKKFVKHNSLIVSLCFTFVLAQAPWLVLGTGTLPIPYPLPGILAAQLLYLFVVLLLRESYTWASVIAVVLTLVHVQVGSIALIFCLSTAIMLFIKHKRINPSLIIAALSAATVMLLNLIIRPVAGDFNTFVEACETLIPYHCSAHQWGALYGWAMILSSIGFLLLAILSKQFFSENARNIWIATIGLATIGLSLGFIFDFFQIPFLGYLSQGVNIYRVANALFPFVIWTIFLGILIPFGGRKVILNLLLWGFAVSAFMMSPGLWATGGWIRNLIISLVIFAGASLLIYTESKGDFEIFPSNIRKKISYVEFFNRAILVKNSLRRRFPTVVALGVTGVFLAAVILNNAFTIRSLDIQWIPNDSMRNWGNQVESIVPSGEVILSDPTFVDARLLTSRAIVIDCKYGPYAGPAWEEWKQRTSDLGGCQQGGYEKLSGTSLNELSKKYNAKFVILGKDQYEKTQKALKRLGWVVKIYPDSSQNLPALLYKT